MKHRAPLRSVLCAALVGAWSGTAYVQPAPAQHAPHRHAAHPVPSAPIAGPAAIAALIAAARSATERYHDRAAAIADGFRLLGPDFPAMGEHWVHPGRMVDGTLDVARPQALSYARIGGRPVLIGVIYARPLRPGEPPPDFPLPGSPWHDHIGAIDEESVLLHHVPTGANTSPGVRLAMLHAWIWTGNPDGVFAADNWALPFLRLGLEVPAHVVPSAARALSLLSGGEVYYLMLFRALSLPTAAEEAAAQEHLRDARVRVEAWYAARSAGAAEVGEADQAGLAALWAALWTETATVMRPEAAARLSLLASP